MPSTIYLTNLQLNTSVTGKQRMPVRYPDYPVRPKPRSVWQKIAVAIRDRHRGGDTAADLALDYDIPEDTIAAVIAAKRADAATRILDRWWREKARQLAALEDWLAWRR